MTVARWDCFPDRASARRAAALALHPDRGGDPVAFAAAMIAVDAQFDPLLPTVGHSSARFRRRRRPTIHSLAILRRLRPRRRRYIEL